MEKRSHKEEMVKEKMKKGSDRKKNRSMRKKEKIKKEVDEDEE